MRVFYALLIFVLATGIAVAQQPLKDHSKCKDHELFTRMPGYFMPYDSYCKEVQFDAVSFTVQKGTSTEKQEVEGHKFEYCFAFDGSGGQAPPSSLQVQRNFQNAAAGIGGKVLFVEKSNYFKMTLFFSKDGKETWAEFKTTGSAAADRYYLTIVEHQGMKQEVAANADALRGTLAESGHAEVPGIFFEFNKSEIKPESRPALQEIVKLLQANPSLRVWVVGHTDNVGTAETNLRLSNSRASAVVAALVQAGIKADRLEPSGVGPFSPVVANTTEEGRARNRRVELVARP